MKQKLAPAKVPELQAPTPADAALLESEVVSLYLVAGSSTRVHHFCVLDHE